MRNSFAHPDGIIKESHYKERVKGWNLNRWKSFQELVNKVARLIKPSSISLDLGAGEGFFTKCCKENGLNFIALEGSKAAVEWGKINLNIDVRVHNLKNTLPFGDNSIDFIMYHDVYEHVPQYINENVFREAYRVLKPKGFFWVITICRYDLVECFEPEHINNPTPSYLYNFGRAFGFTAKTLLPHFNISLFTPNLYDNKHKICLRKKKTRDWAKRNCRRISFILAPLWIPIWFLNSKLLHIDILDAVSGKSDIIFRKK